MSERGEDQDMLATAFDEGEVLEREAELDMQPQIGRYLLLDRLGAGAMGTVFLAHDPELDRKVALKLLRGGASEPTQLRTQREAQAMAQLAHANVAAIYDVGRFGRELFLAMEYLPGGNLATWLGARERSWSEILAQFIAAGRGLEAAHTLGLVHRDFKPANVMLSADQTPKVTDFGLVRSAHAEAPAEPLPPAEGPLPGSPADSSVFELELTGAGARLGTPAYMAPEQIRGDALVDARSDQFSFCVALHEALWGRSPFAGDGVEARLREVLADQRVPRPSRSGVPSWLEPIIDRGLSADRDARWPSMGELLAALSEDPAGRRRLRRRRAWVAGLGLALVVGFVGQRQLSEARCARASAAAARDWQARAPALEAALSSEGSSYALANLERLRARAQDWSARWAEARGQLCAPRPSAVEREQQRCLDEQRGLFRGLLDSLSEDAERTGVAARAILALTSLPEPRACADPDYALARAGSCEPALGRALSRVRALETTGRYREALDAAEQLSEDPALRACPTLEDQLLIHTGRLASRFGRGEDQTRARLLRGLHQAGAREDLPTARSAAFAMFELERDAGALLAAQTWLEIIELLDARLGDRPEALSETRLARAELARRRGERESAREQLRALEALIRDTLGEAHPRYLDYLVAAAELERDEAKRALLERALAMSAALYGPAHPSALRLELDLLDLQPDRERRFARSGELAEAIGEAYGPRHRASLAAADRHGVAMLLTRRYEQAVPYYAALVERHERAEPLAPLPFARALNHYGIALRRTHQLEAAELALRRGAELLEAQLGPDSSELGPSLLNLANVIEQRGRIHEAIAMMRRAERVFGATAILLDNRGMLELEIGHHDEALRDIRRAAELNRAELEPEDLAHIDVLTDLARAELGNGKVPEARARFEGLLERCDAHSAPHNLECAYTRGIVAEFLLEHPASEEPGARAGELARALQLGEAAVEHVDESSSPLDALHMRFIHARLLAATGQASPSESAAAAAALSAALAARNERRAGVLRARVETWREQL